MMISLILLALNFVLATIFIYYKYHSKKCKSLLYTKVNKVLLNYLGLLIIQIINIIISILLNIKCEYLRIIGIFIFIVSILIQFGLRLANLIIVQKYYNKTTTWENCGNFHGWMKFWLIINYIGFVCSLFNELCLNNEVYSDS
jgi:hypothetical protein